MQNLKIIGTRVVSKELIADLKSAGRNRGPKDHPLKRVSSKHRMIQEKEQALIKEATTMMAHQGIQVRQKGSDLDI